MNDYKSFLDERGMTIETGKNDKNMKAILNLFLQWATKPNEAPTIGDSWYQLGLATGRSEEDVTKDWVEYIPTFLKKIQDKKPSEDELFELVISAITEL